MQNNSNNNDKMYTSTPRKIGLHCGSDSCHNVSVNNDTGYSSQQYYTLPLNSSTTSEQQSIQTNSEYHSIPCLPVNDTITPNQPNENEFNIEKYEDSIDDMSHIVCRTPNNSLAKTNYCQPAYFTNLNENEAATKKIIPDSTDIDDVSKDYTKYCAQQASYLYCTDKSSIVSKEKNGIAQNFDDIDYSTDLQYYCENDRRPCGTDEDDEDESTDFNQKLILNISNDPLYHNKDFDSNFDHKPDENLKYKYTATRPDTPIEKYPNFAHYSKNISPPRVQYIHDEDYKQIPTFNCSSDSTEPSSFENSGNFDKALDPMYMKYSPQEDLNAKTDSINMLSVVISTIMLLASKSQIPHNYITWTLKYLKCIKNKQGLYPPNIKKIQKMLSLPTGQWNCKDQIKGKTPGKWMDLTNTRRKQQN